MEQTAWQVEGSWSAITAAARFWEWRNMKDGGSFSYISPYGVGAVVVFPMAFWLVVGKPFGDDEMWFRSNCLDVSKYIDLFSLRPAEGHTHGIPRLLLDSWLVSSRNLVSSEKLSAMGCLDEGTTRECLRISTEYGVRLYVFMMRACCMVFIHCTNLLKFPQNSLMATVNDPRGFRWRYGHHRNRKLR